MSKQKTLNSQVIAKIFMSRKIILDLAKSRGFNTENYENFTINDILIMNTNKQLDMLLTNNNTGKKIYYKYHLTTKIRGPHIQDYIEDIYLIDEVINKVDDLIIVVKDKPNDVLKNMLKMEFINNEFYVNIYNLHNYQFNILENDLVPDHKILSEEEKKIIAKKYNILKDSQWPEINRFDPPAMAIGLRPGEVTEITRNSPTALETKYYRLCN
jgi:DNA-directed RNA polymerase subunit H (RpoH/RPB5)